MWIAVFASLVSLCGGAASAECLFGQPVDGYEEIAADIVNDWSGLTENGEDVRVYPGVIRVSEIDLDRDGTPELCIKANTSATCSMGISICGHLIWSQSDERVLLNVGTHRLGFGGYVPDSWPDLRSEYASNDGYVYEVIYRNTEDVYLPLCSRPIGYWAGQASRPPVEGDC